MPKPPRTKTSPARQVCLSLLRRWRQGEGYAADLLAEAMGRAEVPDRDRALLQTMLYGVLRNLRLLDHWIGHLRAGGRLGEDERDLLRLGLCQVLVLGLPDHAAVDTTVACAGRARGLVNAVLRRAIREREELMAELEQLPVAVRGSHPEWLVDRWDRQWGSPAAAAMVEWNQQPAPVWLRLNRLKASAWDEVRELAEQTPGRQGVSACDLEWLGDLAEDFRCVARLPKAALEQGLVYAQDPSTAVACRLLAPQPGEVVLDACAAPGGKTALLWQIMQRQGRLIGCDLPGGRLDRLTSNLRRLGADGAEVRAVDWLGEAGTADLPQVDRILLDLPCSNTGVMRRRIDVRWRLRPDEFRELADLQRRIVKSVLPSLKPGGVLVYSTCSLDQEENQDNLALLVGEVPGLRVVDTHATQPWQHAVDGGFAARLTWRAGVTTVEHRHGS